MHLVPPDTPKPKAYSYLRFSTPEQQKGDSFRRQTQLAADYAARKGLELDDTLTLHDLGVSGFRGENAETGMLAYFKEAVESGEVPHGSYLLVESLDRISRQSARKAFRVLEDIADLGVTVVTLIDEREYSRASMEGDPMALIFSILTFMRANEESATKQRRLKEVWSSKRRSLGSKPLTSKAPAWLKLDRESGQFILLPDRQAIVERIFRETLEGVGQHQIAARLNREGVQPWGRANYWHRSYIKKILESEAVVGTFTAHSIERIEGKKRRKPEAKREGYFPPAISDELWQDVQAFRAGKHSRSRGRHAAQTITNMLAGLARCPLCGNTMTRTNKGSRSRPSYVCTRAKNKAGCRYKSVRVELVEEAIVKRLPARLRNAPAGERNPAMDHEIHNLEAEADTLRDKIDNLLSAIEAEGQTARLVGRLRELEGQYDSARERLRELETRRASVAGATVHARLSRLLAALEPEHGEVEPGAVNAALQTVFRQAIINYRAGTIEFEWGHGGSVEIPYAWPVMGVADQLN